MSESARLACPSCATPYDDPETRFCGNCGTDVRSALAAGTEPASTADPMLGRVIDGRYRVQARIGQGGMGVVYRVEHVAMGKVAAMKILHPSLSQEAEVVRRFRREAEAVSRLSHPNTVQVFDFGQSQGSMYLVMELIRGEDLGALLRRDSALTWRRLGLILSQVLDALEEAHELGIIHRDIKPENLLIARTRDGRDLVKVLDFGLAKLRDVEELNAVTGRGTVIGTPYYMSPEQIRAEDLDASSDLYSLGALAYRALTSEHPFSAATPVAVLTQHLTAELEAPRVRAPTREIPPAAEAIVMRAMQKRREDRYQSAAEMRAAVVDAIHDPSSDSARHEIGRRSSDSSASGVSAVGVAERLKREDFDSYERSLRLRRYVALSLVPLILLCAAIGGYYLVRRAGPRVLDEEREPNDTPTHANLVESGRPIRGQIGKRRSTEESDRDFFHLPVTRPNNRLTVETSGIREMDLILQVFDGAGKEIAESETGAEGDSEAIFSQRVSPGDYYVQVREVWVGGQQANENVSDWYTLKAAVDVAPIDEELEPNDDPLLPNTIPSTNAITGRLPHPTDVDCYAVGGKAGGSIGASVSALTGVDLRLTLMPATSKLGSRGAGVRIADSGGVGDGEKIERTTLPLTQGVLCVERKDRAAARGAHPEHQPHSALPSRTATYRLTIDRGA